MRILHVTDAFAPGVGGIETFVDGLASRQARTHDVTVLTPTPDHGFDLRRPYDVCRVSPATPLDRGWVGSFDLIHGHLSVLSPLTTRLTRIAARLRVPTVCSVHSLWRDRHSVVRPVAALAGWNRSPILWAPVSRAAAADVRRLLPHARIEVVPNAVDVTWWRAAPVVPHEGVVIFSVMRLAARKRPLELVSMLGRLRETAGDTPWRAVVVGSGPLEAAVAREIGRRGLGDRVTLAGSRTPTEIRRLCATSDVYVAPATLESFGIAALEARAAGLPVVALRSGGVREFIEDGVDGLLRTGDDDIVDGLAALVNDPALRASMTSHNRSVAPTADWSDALARFDTAYAVAAQLARRATTSTAGVAAHAL